MVKLPHAVKKLERGFFTAASYAEFKQKSEALLKQGVITRDALAEARIERYIIGPVFNLDMFYSPIEEEMSKIELLGIDWRFETSLDGHVRLPAPQQMTLNERQITPEYTVCGHNSATLRESLLEDVFELAEKYVRATQKYYKPGIIGPFCLQTCVDKDLNFYVYDVAPRVGGGTNVHVSAGHPYGNTLWRKPMSTGRRAAMEIRRAIEQERVEEIVT
jgi:5-formaminoimidazole-4-carboxamide-1-(beta)-D-ribofuranosyl 5'-monophosphate synthetase